MSGSRALGLGFWLTLIKGPCTQIASTLKFKVGPYIGTLGPKYLLFGYMDPLGYILLGRGCGVIHKRSDALVSTRKPCLEV